MQLHSTASQTISSLTHHTHFISHFNGKKIKTGCSASSQKFLFLSACLSTNTTGDEKTC